MMVLLLMAAASCLLVGPPIRGRKWTSSVFRMSRTVGISSLIRIHTTGKRITEKHRHLSRMVIAVGSQFGGT